MSIVSEPKRCPKCDAPIPAEAPQGLCPKCLLLEISTPTDAGQSAHSKSSPPTREELAAAFPHLEILELIGQGGMGFVFKARQPKLERFVALKILPQSLAADPAFAERFSREGRLLARLNHPNIVTVHDFGQAKEFFYLLMEYVDGVNLRQAMKAGRFTADQALAIVPKICEALQFAHNEGILHRDIKPENILLDTKGRVKIADFGIAKLISEATSFGVPPSGGANRLKPELQTSALTDAGKTLGTPNYMAPEQIEKPNEVDHRADIYSLGVVFYEMLTGELPLGRFPLPSQKSAADPRLDDVVLRALEKEPNRRTQSAGEVKTQVETISNATSRHAVSSEIKEPSASPVSDRFWKRFAITVGLVLLALILIPVFAYLLSFMFQKNATALMEKSVTISSAVEVKRASVGTWSPTIAPGEKFEPATVLEAATKLMKEGSYEDALQRHIWFHNNVQKFGDSYQSTVRLTSAISEWEQLGRRYPKAKQALMEIRDDKTREIIEGRGYAEIFQEVAAINREFQNDDATLTLFKTIRRTDPKLAQQCYFYAENLLITNGEYQLCLDVMGDSQKQFSSLRRSIEMQRDQETRMAEMYKRMEESNRQRGITNNYPRSVVPDTMKKHSEDYFVSRTCRLIEILIGAERKDEAEKIQAQALAIFDDPLLKSAISDAEKRVQKVKATPRAVVIPSPSISDSLASPELLAEPPKLQFLAWQDEFKTNRPGAARHPDGSAITDEKELKWLQGIHTGGMDIRKLKLNPDPRFLHVGISHPLFDTTTFNEITLLDEQGKRIPRGAGDNGSSSAQASNLHTDNLGWLTVTFSPIVGTNIPAQVTMRLRYTIGPLEKIQKVKVETNSRTSMTLEGGGQLNGLGQTVDGNAFIAIAVNPEKLGARKFGAVAVTRDGIELLPTGDDSRGTDRTDIGTQSFEFDVPLNEVALFRIGTRPIRTAVWKIVVLSVT